MTPALNSMVLALTWHPPLAPWAVVLGAAAAMAAAWLTWRHRQVGPVSRMGLIAMRIAAIGALAVVLLGPQRPSAITAPTERLEAAILVDTSASMNHDDISPTRFGFALRNALNRAAISAMEQAANISLHRFDENSTPTSIEELRDHTPDGKATHLIRALRALVVEGPADRRAIVVLSDGRDTRATPDGRFVDYVIDLARTRDVSIFAVPLGQADPGRDVSVQLRDRRSGLFDGEQAELIATVRRRGGDDEPIAVTLRADGKIIETAHMHFQPGEPARRIEFRHTPTTQPDLPTRMVHYAARVEPLDGETDPTNNTGHALVGLLGRRISVLLLEGVPHWDTRFFARALEADPQVTVTTVHAVTADRVIMTRPSEDGERDVPVDLPISEAMLGEFDVLLLGRGMKWFFPGDQAALLDRFVTTYGGGLVFVRGMPYGEDDPQGRAIVEPLVADEHDDGPLRVIRRVAPDGRGSAEAVRRHVGRGRALTVRTADLWRWSMSGDETGAYPAAYRGFVGDCVRWAAVGDGFAPSAEVSLRTNRTVDAVGEARTIRLRLREPAMLKTREPKRLAVTGPNGRTAQVAVSETDDPLERTGAFTPTEPGVYEVHFGEERTKFIATATDAEHADLSADRALLTRLSEQTGGAVIEGGIASYLANLPGDAATSRAGPPAPAWDQWWVFALIIGAPAVEWFTRRRMGLA